MLSQAFLNEKQKSFIIPTGDGGLMEDSGGFAGLVGDGQSVHGDADSYISRLEMKE